MSVPKLVIVFCFAYAVFNVTGAAVIKHKLIENKVNGFYEFIVFLIDPKIFLAFMFIILSMFFSIKALSLSAFSTVIPLSTGINFIVTVLVGALFFKDQLTLMGYIGIILILSGVLFLGKGYSGT